MYFYIYQHRAADTNQIFYVGKGKDKRFSDQNKRDDMTLECVCSQTWFCRRIY